MAVSLDKVPQLHLFVAVVTDTGTDSATVHHLGLTDAFYYDDQVSRAWDVKHAVPGSAVHLVVAEDRSAGYREARNGDSADELINPFFTDEDDDVATLAEDDEEPEIESIAGYLHGQEHAARLFGDETPTSTPQSFDQL